MSPGLALPFAMQKTITRQSSHKNEYTSIMLVESLLIFLILVFVLLDCMIDDPHENNKGEVTAGRMSKRVPSQ